MAEWRAAGVGKAHLDRAARPEGGDLVAGGDVLARVNARVDALVDEDDLPGALTAEQLVEDATAFRPAWGADVEDFGVAHRGDRSGAREVDALVDAAGGGGEEGADVFGFEARVVADVDVVVVVGEGE